MGGFILLISLTGSLFIKLKFPYYSDIKFAYLKKLCKMIKDTPKAPS